MYHVVQEAAQTNGVSEECLDQLRHIIERINCDEDVSASLGLLIQRFKGTSGYQQTKRFTNPS